MSRHQRNTWGINFQKEGPKVSYNANPPPACLNDTSQMIYNTSYVTPTPIQPPNKTYSSIGKRRMKDDDEYFNEEEESAKNNDLEYIPGPNSPVNNKQGNDSDGSEDPLDAYMNEIDNELQNPDLNKKAELPKRYDLEREDEIESYIKYMEQNPHVGMADEDQTVYEYDNEGNIVNKEKKAVEPLPPTDHSVINYLNFTKNFYVPHGEISQLTNNEVLELLKKLGLTVRGYMPPKPVCSFAHFGFDEKLMTVIRKSSFTTPTPIQAQGIPAALSGRDIIGIAKTGSGKTAAFLWPMIVHIMDQPELKLGDGPIGLICAPTRELAQQIYQEAIKFSKAYNIQVVCTYGGGNMYEQQKACEAGCEILVCTPGRLIDIIKKKSTNLRRVTYLVFDEADKMFNLGFESQVNSIAKNVRPDRQTLLFSATFKYKVEKLAREALTDPIKIVQGNIGEANEDVIQSVLVLNKEDDKWPWLAQNIIRFTTDGSVLIFTTRKLTCVEIGDKLLEHGYECLLIHGDVHQLDRNTIISRFKKKEVRILVATDVASRGLDIPVIRTVINYDVARDIDTHTHRIGRTGRAGMKGRAYTLVTREKDKEFAGHLVRNLEGASQQVPPELLTLANQSSWFHKSRTVNNGSGKKISDNLGVRLRPGLGSGGDSSSNSNHMTQFSDEPYIPSVKPVEPQRRTQGPQADRLSTIKAAFSTQYSRMFVCAGVEGSVYTHPQRLSTHPTEDLDVPTSSSNHSVEPGKKKSRWGN